MATAERERVEQLDKRIKGLVLLTEPIHQDAMEELCRAVEIQILPNPVEDAILSEIGNANAPVLGIICRTSPITARTISAGSELLVIGRHGVGLDNIDVEAATNAGVAVVHTPGANAISVAEHVLALMLALAKNLRYWDYETRRGLGYELRREVLNWDLHGKTLGIVGLGKIGIELAKKAFALGMTVIGYDPYAVVPADVKLQVATDLSTVLALADIISIHVPLTPETRGMIGKKELALLKPTAILINCARGAVIDRGALLEALRERRIAGAGIDVFDPEPPPVNDPLFQLDNVIVTPHVAARTRESYKRMSWSVVEGVLDVLSGRRPRYLANPGVWEKSRVVQQAKSP